MDLYGILEDSGQLDKLRRSGPVNAVAVCPYHSDSAPSFAINLNTGLWLCYACGARGNSTMLLRDMGLGHYAGRLSPIAPEFLRDDDDTDPLLEDYVLEAFRMCPRSLLDVGFSMEVLADFEIGYDRHRRKITYPIRNNRGGLIGITGRAMTDNTRGPKYLPYGEDEVGIPYPKKSHHLYNAHRVLDRGDKDDILVVEGFKGCMWLEMLGYSSTSMMTNRLSLHQHDILMNLPHNDLYLVPDNDTGGREGATVTLQRYPIFDGVIVIPDPYNSPDDMSLAEFRELQPLNPILWRDQYGIESKHTRDDEQGARSLEERIRQEKERW